jgi:heme-degrading monooxygenase HmoA
MITRIWHGRTSLRNGSRYLEFLLNDGTKEYRATPGNVSVKVWKRDEQDCCHFYTVTEWVDLEAVKRFAGEDYEKAVYYPEDDGILLEFEGKVMHYESFDVTGQITISAKP